MAKFVAMMFGELIMNCMSRSNTPVSENSRELITNELRELKEKALKEGRGKFHWTNHLKALFLAGLDFGYQLAQDIARILAVPKRRLDGWLCTKAVTKEYNRLVAVT